MMRWDGKLSGPETACVLICACGLVMLFGLVAMSGTTLVYDEPYYMDVVASVHEHGLSARFLQNVPGPAGPLHALVHYVLEPLSHLRPPRVRFVNLALLGVMIGGVWGIARLQRSARPFLTSLSVVSIPMTWVVAGLALTEIPAMCLAVLALLLLLYAVKPGGTAQWMAALGGGLIFSAAILGRQPFLAVLLALPLLLTRQSFIYLVLFLCAALPLPLVVFYVWGGIVPPQTAYAGAGGLSITHGALAFAYAGMVMLIVAPGWFNLGATWTGLAFASAVVLNSFLSVIQVTPAMTMAQRVVGDGVALSLYQHVTSGLLLAVGVVFVTSAVRHLWRRRADRVFCFLCAASILLVGTAAKVTLLFSSRYTAMAIPLLLLTAEPFSVESYAKAVRMSLGVVCGALILASYFG